MQPVKWKIDVPIFKNPQIVKQLALAIGLPFMIPAVIILIVTWGTNQFQDTKFAFGLIGLTIVLAVLLVQVVYRGSYAVEFRVDRKGVSSRTQAKQAKANSVLQKLLVVFGALSRNPTVMGAGILAQTRHQTHIPWRRIRSIRYLPMQHTILIKGGWTESIALFCPEDSYDNIKKIIEESDLQRQ